MAVVAVTSQTARVPAGPYWMQTFRATIAGADAADEWIVTGFKNIIMVVGDAVLGATEGAKTNNYVKNAQGTGVAAGTNPGDLGIETELAADLEVTILGQ